VIFWRSFAHSSPLLRRASSIVAFLFIGLASPGLATTVQELIEKGDAFAQAENRFPQSLEDAVASYKRAAALEPQNPLPHIRMARAYLALGDASKDNALQSYERGESAAERALALQEADADTHLLLAANRGKAVNLRPFWKISPGVIGDLEQHLMRALALDPRHARALHMMGMLLYRTPGPLRLLLTGKKEQVEPYLVQAVKADPNFTEARFDLAQFYMQSGKPSQARAHAEAILTMPDPASRRAWSQKYRPAAEALLKNLPAQ
jgi:cytochrome c-type biogenesis protein CcmH/NrfG